MILTPLAAAVVLSCLSKSLWRAGFDRRLRVKLPIQYQRLQCRYEDEQDDRPDKHATYNHGSERPLDLAPYTGRNGCRSKPMQAESAVISMGRIRCEAARNIASVVPMPVALTSL